MPQETVTPVPEFSLLLPSRDREWANLRARLISASREMHSSAIAHDGANGAALLVIAGKLAELALTIPNCPVHATPGALVDVSTLFAAQIQRDSSTGGNAIVPVKRR